MHRVMLELGRWLSQHDIDPSTVCLRVELPSTHVQWIAAAAFRAELRPELIDGDARVWAPECACRLAGIQLRFDVPPEARPLMAVRAGELG